MSVLFFALLAWLTRGLGNEGLWLTFLAFMAVRGVSLAWFGLRIRRRHAWMA
jgi:MATE family multidrug resistance protein